MNIQSEVRNSLRVRRTVVVLITVASIFYATTGSALGQKRDQSVVDFGGGEFNVRISDEMSQEEREMIKRQIQTNIDLLTLQGRLEAATPQFVPLGWPVRKANGVRDFNIDGISNFVDQNLSFPNQCWITIVAPGPMIKVTDTTTKE